MADIRPEPGSQSIDKLFASSELVMRGEVTGVSATGSVKGSWHGVPTSLTTYAANVAVDKVYKGRAASTIRVEYVRPSEHQCAVSTCIGLVVGEFDYFFLAGSEANYELRDPYFGTFRASRLTDSGHKVGIEGLKQDFVSGLEDHNERVRLTQVELVGAAGRKHDADRLKRLLAKDILTCAAAYHALLRLGDYSTLASMRGFLETRSKVPAVERQRFLSLSLINTIRDSAAVDSLLQLAKSSTDDLREVAIHALRTIGSTKAVPVFAHALDDNVQMIRYDSVLALAEIEQNWPLAPSTNVFQADEAKYISAWKLWWETSGRHKYGL
jgi:hypothetical protein